MLTWLEGKEVTMVLLSPLSTFMLSLSLLLAMVLVLVLSSGQKLDNRVIGEKRKIKREFGKVNKNEK